MKTLPEKGEDTMAKTIFLESILEEMNNAQREYMTSHLNRIAEDLSKPSIEESGPPKERKDEIFWKGYLRGLRRAWEIAIEHGQD